MVEQRTFNAWVPGSNPGGRTTFTYMGYPSTYLVEKQELSKIFQQLRKVYAPANGYWVVEFADGILQRETALLLQDPDVQKHIHKLVFCAHDAVGVIGGIQVLKQRFGLEPDAISGYCSSSPLAV